MLIDAHCHLANLSRIMPLEPLMEEAAQHQIQGYLSSALSRAEIAYYQKLGDKRIKFSAGIHPHYEECDLELIDIARLCEAGSIWAVGEIGVDRYGPPLAEQIPVFEAQLQLAQEHGLSVVLHIVGHQQRAWELIRGYPLRYLVHGYAGSVEAYRLLTRENSWFTISERILKPDKQRLLDEILEGGRYLFETDITRFYVQKGEANPLLRLNRLLDVVQTRSGIAIEQLIHTQYQNYLQLTGQELD